MDSIDFFQVFIIIIIIIMTLFYIYFRSLTFSSSAAVDTDIPPLQEKYDVFISFRGEDTRDAFTSHLHKALLGKKIETYMDYRLEKGDDIGPALLEAIEKSKIALVIFSKDYASSTWCLKELVHILGCKKSHGQIVIPIFYRIDPSHVRKQKGTYALGGLFWRLKKRFKGSMDEMANWRAALEEAANISGFHDSSKTGRTEADFVEEVVQDVLIKLNRESLSDLKGLAGIEKKIGKIKSLLCLDSPGVCCVGIWGMGGIGKTTLADAVFHKHSSKFEVCCFLANVREKSEKTDGLHQLRNKLVGEILKQKDVNIDTPSIPPHIQYRLRHTKALIVLDDVNAASQLEVLVGDRDQFCQGSRIIITARDKGVLEQKVDHDKIYKVEGLSSEEALQLFHSHAFRNKSPTTDYTELSREVIDYIKGIPLALKVMGSSFLPFKSKQEWEDQLNKLKRFPSEEIKRLLRVSYDGLEENEKEIFLDIAWFHKGKEMNDVKRTLDSRGFFGEVGIKVLIDRSLISISKWNNIEMHDLVQEMGRAIVRGQFIEESSRLFIEEDVYQVNQEQLMDTSTAAEPSSPTFSSLSLEDEMYDVFLSCRCQDTRNTFTDHLYWRLKTARVDVFIDENELREGEIIPDELKQVIEQCKIAVIIFSKRYADSIRCLEVLEKIMECRRTLGRMVLPIFYHVDSKVVRCQTGSFEEAFQTHEVRFHGVKDKEEKILSWRKCLTEAAGLDGLFLSEINGYEGRFISKIISEVTQKLKSTCLDIARKQVGIDSTMQKSSNYPEVQVVDRNMNSSSPPYLPVAAPLQEKYDVFLSFRGEDTHDTFTSHLHKALLRKNIDTYIDNRLEIGDDIGPILREAIEKSKIALVIFSKDYASSTRCLKELVHILECKKSYGKIVIPIFYRIYPSDVRKQQGTYALEDRALKRSRDEVANWRAALEEAANMSGFHYSSKTGTEADFVETVVQDVLTKLNRKSSSDLKGLFGIEEKIEKIESLLCLDSPGVCCVGIWGMGGIGKTTLADAVFNRLASEFEASCFLKNVRENSEGRDGIYHLRNTLVRDLLKDKDVNINTPSIPRHIQDRLRRTKALIVLDDVNARKQLESLVGDDDRFCQGSRIIITARDKGLLEQKVDPEKIYNVEGLCSDEALKLFHSHAFGNKSPTTDYTELSREVVDYIKGIPLALKVMGSSFRRCKSKQEWEVQWKKVKEFPDEEINQVLRISYDGLGKHEKEIFLDIACFHKYGERNYVEEVLDGSGFCGKKGINDLIDRSLISISYFHGKELIEMHDLVEEMGKAIAEEQGSRLLMAKDVNQLLANNQSDGHVQAISVDFGKMEYANFEKMHQLRWLRVHSSEHLATSLIGSLGLPNSLRYLSWYKYPLKSLPSKFSAQNLVVLKMLNSQVEGQLWNEDQSPNHLKWIDLKHCMHLTKVPDLSRSLQIEHIDLNGCRRLVEIPSYFQHLGKLTYLHLGSCENLKNLPEMPCNLEFLDLSWTAIEELPSSVWSHEKISRLDITSCKHLKSLPSNTCKLKLSLSLEGCESLCEFWELPRDTTELALTSSTIKELRINALIESVVGLTAIKLINCKSLVSLPTNIWKLKSLKSLDLSWCSKFQYFPKILEPMEHLEFLNLSGTAVKELPPSIGNLIALRELELRNCKNLEVVPDELFCLTSLQVLNLSGTEIKSLPASIKQAAQLSRLFLDNCKSLESLPELPPLLQCFDIRGCTSLKTVSSSSSAIAQGIFRWH